MRYRVKAQRTVIQTVELEFDSEIEITHPQDNPGLIDAACQELDDARDKDWYTIRTLTGPELHHSTWQTDQAYILDIYVVPRPDLDLRELQHPKES